MINYHATIHLREFLTNLLTCDGTLRSTSEASNKINTLLPQNTRSLSLIIFSSAGARPSSTKQIDVKEQRRTPDMIVRNIVAMSAVNSENPRARNCLFHSPNLERSPDSSPTPNPNTHPSYIPDCKPRHNSAERFQSLASSNGDSNMHALTQQCGYRSSTL